MIWNYVLHHQRLSRCRRAEMKQDVTLYLPNDFVECDNLISPQLKRPRREAKRNPNVDGWPNKNVTIYNNFVARFSRPTREREISFERLVFRRICWQFHADHCRVLRWWNQEKKRKEFLFFLRHINNFSVIQSSDKTGGVAEAPGFGWKRTMDRALISRE